MKRQSVFLAVILFCLTFSLLSCSGGDEDPNPLPEADMADVDAEVVSCREIFNDEQSCLDADCDGFEVLSFTFSKSDGCQALEPLYICVFEDGGDAQSEAYWRELEDGTFQSWASPYLLYDQADLSIWTHCGESISDETFHEACRCTSTTFD